MNVSFRYRYEIVEQRLDRFVAGLDADAFSAFRGAYDQLKVAVALHALLDPPHPGAPFDVQLASAWQRAEIAFRGDGESKLSARVARLWETVEDAPDVASALCDTLEQAFAEADARTPPEVERLCPAALRARPIRAPVAAPEAASEEGDDAEDNSPAAYARQVIAELERYWAANGPARLSAAWGRREAFDGDDTVPTGAMAEAFGVAARALRDGAPVVPVVEIVDDPADAVGAYLAFVRDRRAKVRLPAIERVFRMRGPALAEAAASGDRLARFEQIYRMKPAALARAARGGDALACVERARREGEVPDAPHRGA